MNGSPRYAIYFIPRADCALYRFGAGMLGYDCYAGTDVAHPGDAGLPADWAALTEAPRRYGFHATLKAPFRLAAHHSEAMLMDAVAAFAGEPREIPMIEPVVQSLGEFIAIMPRECNPVLDRFAADCVTAFDRFRSPPSAADLARRQASELSARERTNLERWGYPYVFEDFRFHMTLTGPVDENRREVVADLLARLFHRCCRDDSITVDRVALLRQDHEGSRFRVLAAQTLRSRTPVASLS